MVFKPFGKHMRNSPKLYPVMANTNIILDDITCIKKYEVPIQVSIMTWFNNIQKSWPLKDIVPTIANVPLYQTGHGVFQTKLKVLLFNLVDMHTPSPRMEEDIKFPGVLNVKQILEFACLKILRSFSPVWTLQTNASGPRNFLWICTMIENDSVMKFSFGSNS
jgi:hypothetical protein